MNLENLFYQISNQTQAGIPRINVRFSLDADGILFVSASEESSGKEKNLAIKTNSDLSIQEMRLIVESSIKNAKDIDLRLLIEAKIKAQKLLMRLNVENIRKKLCSKNEIIEINKIIKMMKIELNSDNKEKIIKLVEQLNEKTKGFAEKIINSNFPILFEKRLILYKQHDKDNVHRTDGKEVEVDAQNGLHS